MVDFWDQLPILTKAFLTCGYMAIVYLLLVFSITNNLRGKHDSMRQVAEASENEIDNASRGGADTRYSAACGADS